MNHAFIDSCVFISYATEFEDFHSSCITFFDETDCYKCTSESVKRELSLKLKKRNRLYQDYSKFLSKRGTEDYKVSPDIYLNKNDVRHLKEIVEQLSVISAHEQLTFLRQFNKRLGLRIERVVTNLNEVIPRNSDSYFKALINTIIPNEDDSWILNDAIHWSLTTENATFVTLDGEIYYNRDKLLKMVVKYKNLCEPPIEIVHGKNF